MQRVRVGACSSRAFPCITEDLLRRELTRLHPTRATPAHRIENSQATCATSLVRHSTHFWDRATFSRKASRVTVTVVLSRRPPHLASPACSRAALFHKKCLSEAAVAQKVPAWESAVSVPNPPPADRPWELCARSHHPHRSPQVAKPVLLALSYLHGRGIIHRVRRAPPHPRALPLPRAVGTPRHHHAGGHPKSRAIAPPAAGTALTLTPPRAGPQAREHRREQERRHEAH